VNMWMDVLKRLPLDEKYCHLGMKGLTCLFRVSRGVQEPYAVCQSLQYDDYMFVMCREIHA
jgi:hypothetical protein